ncbi:MAG TPA: hypothetical protein V6C76_10950 [Drouetiella sp.]
MKKHAILTLSALVGIGLAATAAKADTYSTVTTTDGFPSAVTESRTTTVESAPIAPTTVIHDQPVIVQPESKEVVVVKKNHHHLINVGPVKVF